MSFYSLSLCFTCNVFCFGHFMMDGWMGGWVDDDDDDDVLAVVYHDGGWARSLEIADRGLLLQSGNANAIKTTHTPPPKLYFPTFLLFRQG